MGIDEALIRSRGIELAIPDGAPREIMDALSNAAAYGKTQGVTSSSRLSSRAGMSDFDYGKATGNILFWDMGEFYRLTSRVFCFVEGLDFDQGLDLFVPHGASDAELGAEIRRCHAASRRVNVKDMPRYASAAKERAAYRAWEKIALDKLGVKKFADIVSFFSAADSYSNDQVFVFKNYEEKKGEFFAVRQADPAFREFVVSKSATDAELGHIARDALSAIVRPKK
ncbi:hypothetical protein [Defluviimonas sp. WL0075]|uniref:Uncharacterized protein n=1 Tax=Albidovulum sediminicola TaxID=2984331 RepID=A0ABT2Z5H3_9RHOB|nr:hypothetical protein [Defluviimonas sp. WL0075]MCV2866383.1 hypothetical protein [Defluviimonas sp. WL0075]